MGKASSVWGLEIGQSALKALRCTSEGDEIVAEAFDYIEYPKILSQPDADPETFVREALETFAKRNDLKKCKVSLSVPGQSGLAKFFKPPPVELKKIRDIVKYEAKQQIPFELDDVIWDYQLMAGGDISDGFALESEVGLFAMKRDAVHRALAPLDVADIEIDLLQLAPLSIYNMITYDKNLAEDLESTYDSEHPPKSIVLLAMGTDATDLIVTNGYRVWQRSMPLGGNHFTRQLTKDLKLTYAKAEHLKRNAMDADDPKLVFQAMRPVFNDLVTEIQRSMGFFRSLNKNAEIGSLIMMGNSVKLPGLTQYLSKNLAMDIEVVEQFSRLGGADEVLKAPAFHDHIASFAPVYGLCLQGLEKGPVTTNLVPQEVVKERMIRSKKPWAVAAAALLMTGFAANLLPAGFRWGEVHPSKWQEAMKAATDMKSQSDLLISEDEKQLNQLKILQSIGEEVAGNGERRVLWMEALNAVFHSLNRSPDFFDPPDPLEVPYDARTDIHITMMDCKHFDNLKAYLTKDINKVYADDLKSRLDLLNLREVAEVADESELEAEEGFEGELASEPVAYDLAAALGATDVEGEEIDLSGWVIQFDAYHYHNGPQYAADYNERKEFVIKGWLHELETGSVVLPVPVKDANGLAIPGQVEQVEFTYRELGLIHPLIIPGSYNEDFTIANPEWIKAHSKGAAGGGYGGGYGGPGMGGGMGPGMGPGMGGGMGPGMGPGEGGYGGGEGGYGGAYGGTGQPVEDENLPRTFSAPKYSFKMQIIWKPTNLSARLAARERAAQEAAENAEGAADGYGAEGELDDPGTNDAGDQPEVAPDATEEPAETEDPVAGQ